MYRGIIKYYTFNKQKKTVNIKISNQITVGDETGNRPHFDLCPVNWASITKVILFHDYCLKFFLFCKFNHIIISVSAINIPVC